MSEPILPLGILSRELNSVEKLQGYDLSYESLERADMSYKQCQFLLALRYNENYDKIKEVLNNLGINKLS